MEISITLNDIEQVEATLLTKKKFEDKNKTKENPTKCHQQIGLKCEKTAKKNKKITSGFIKASPATHTNSNLKLF